MQYILDGVGTRKFVYSVVYALVPSILLFSGLLFWGPKIMDPLHTTSTLMHAHGHGSFQPLLIVGALPQKCNIFVPHTEIATAASAWVERAMWHTNWTTAFAFPRLW